MYQFTELKEFIEKRLGIDTTNAKSNFIPIKKTFPTFKDVVKNVELSPEGIFYIDKDGNRYKGFLYIEGGYSDWSAQKYGTKIPKFHILNCKTIQKQKQRDNFNGHYVFANTKILIEDIDGIEKEPLLCKNCIDDYPTEFRRMKTSEFVEEIIKKDLIENNFSEEDLPKAIDIRADGYTSDWEQESREYRRRKKYTCESCGIKLNKTYADGYYLETHHINNNKKDNREENLKCLCTLCHAFSNEYHINNYKMGKNRSKLLAYLDHFYAELNKVNNAHLNELKIVNIHFDN